jgi:pimeloyl-ACP methyl ester carboxylesterase
MKFLFPHLKIWILLLLMMSGIVLPGEVLLGQEEEPVPLEEESGELTGEGMGAEITGSAENALGSRLEALYTYPCPPLDLSLDANAGAWATSEPLELICVPLQVPLDPEHPAENPEEEQTLEVVFAVKPAPGRSRGMLVVAVGGPGEAGIEAGYDYLSEGRFGTLLTQELDIVFFDQRGVGLSHPLDCPAAHNDYSEAGWNNNPETPAGEAEMIIEARRFAQACQQEMNAPDLLPYLATRYAVEDLELFLEVIGQKQIYLYGESYGTQYAQTFATAHPERLAGLILDGVVDLSLSGEEFYRTYVTVMYDNLLATLHDCNKDPDCAKDLGGDAVAHFEALVVSLKEQAVRVRFPLPAGGFEERTFGYPEFRLAVGWFDQRATLHALAAAARQDYLPLLRLYYSVSGIEPQLNQPAYQPDLDDLAPAMTLATPQVSVSSDGAYFNVDCADYQFFEGSPNERAQAFLDAGNALEAEFPVFSVNFYTDLPCIFWSTSGSQARAKPFRGGHYPTFIINGTADTQTPIDNGYAVYQRIKHRNGYMITQRAGGHVHFGSVPNGVSCPDKILIQFLLQRTLPNQREFLCSGYFIEDRYTPLALPKASDYPTPLALVEAVVHEIEWLPEFSNLTDGARLVGCPHGGVMGIGEHKGWKNLSFANCSMIEGFAMTGTGNSGFDSIWPIDLPAAAPSFALHVSVTGDATGQITYLRDGIAGTVTIDGDYAGKPLRPVAD